MKKNKILVTLACAALLVAASVAGTLAYLTSTDNVNNTFTVGHVQITLDEAKVGTDGKALTGNNARRVKTNSYNLIPGHVYDKDPTVTVKANSEEAYIKMVVTVNKASQLKKILTDHSITSLSPTIIGGYDKTKWVLKSTAENSTANTITYTFYYKSTVDAGTSDVVLEDLFTTISVPSALTNSEMETLEGLTITVNAYAMQKDGFATADLAWANYPTT